MNASTHKRRLGLSSFNVCFYCNETFRTLASLYKHCCSAEGQELFDWTPLEIVSDTEVDLSEEDSIFTAELSIENPLETPPQEVAESNVSNVSEIESDKTSETQSTEVGHENKDQGSDASEELSEPNSNVVRNETALTIDTPEKSLEPNVDVARKNTDGSEKQLSEVNSDVLSDISEQKTDESEKRLSEVNSDTLIDGDEQRSDESEKLAIAIPDTVQKITEGESNADEDLNRASPDLVSKVLLYYEKQTKQEIPDNCKSPSTEMEFLSSPSPALESGSLKHDNKDINYCDADNCNKILISEVKGGNDKDSMVQHESDSLKHNGSELGSQISNVCDGHLRMESVSSNSDADNCNKILISEIKGGNDKESMMQEESDSLKHNGSELGSQISNVCDGHLRMESVSSNVFSLSSSVESDLDSLGCGDDPDFYDSDASSAISFSEKNSDVLKPNHVEAASNANKSSKSHSSEINVKSFLEENLNITKYKSIIKPCYVKVQDIFKSLVNNKVSPKKIFSWRKKYHVCDVCFKFFRLRSDLNIHYLIHSTVKPYVCNICNKSFMKQCNLFAHHLSHTVERHHICSVCKKAFTKPSLLMRHMLTHTKEKPFKCEKCDKTYASKSSLTEHSLSHSDARPFVCEICSASFANKRYLRKHYYTHEKKDLVCDMCYKVFKRRHHLEEHYLSHIRDKIYKCHICDRSFNLLLTLNHHLALKHKNEMALILPKKKTSGDHKNTSNPVIQKVTINPVIQKVIACAETDTGEKSPVIERFVGHISKSPASNSTRRKSFIPKRYLQPK